MGDRDDTPGLVLVYCENHQSMQSAYALPRQGPPVTLGREPENAIPIKDQSASRYHARLDPRADGWVITDLGSTNGTYVDGVRVQGEAALTHNAILRVGDTLFKFVARGATPYQAYKIDGTRFPHLSPIKRTTVGGALVGGYLLDQVCERIELVSRSTTRLTVIITGESGTGKEVAAREIHRLSGLAGPFQAINCAAIPDSLIESELFGFRRGAFTGADRDKMGLFKAADGGTLFLDEIGDMPLEVQVKLLRAIQYGEIQPLGSDKPIMVDVHVVCATHRDLQEGIAAGWFRRDFFARLSEFAIHMPPLRARKEDIYLLTRHFMAKYGRPDVRIPFAVMLALVHHDWPYNVRELESAVKRLIALSPGTELDFANLPDPVRDCLRDYGTARVAASPPEPPRAAERPAPALGREAPSLGQLIELLTRHQGNISAISREVGKERVQIHRWLKRHGLSPDDYRPK